MYQQNMTMPFVNTEITSKHCDAMIFFPRTQMIIYYFKDDYGSRMFFAKVLIPFFDPIFALLFVLPRPNLVNSYVFQQENQ